jgi:hypothetical protein
MSSTCTIRVPGGAPVMNATTGAMTVPLGAVVYSGKCRVRPVTARGGGIVEAGGAELFTFDYLVSVPFSVTGVQEGHRLTVVTSPDAALVGVEVQVQKVDRGEPITARRLSCNEVS